MSEIRELLNKINKPSSPYQKMAKVCVVRDFGSDGGTLEKPLLLYNVEPIDNDNFINIKVGDMTTEQLEKSKDNWISDVSVSANPTQKLNNDAVFQLPKIDSYVIVEWLNDTDCYISLLSAVSQVLIQVDDKVQRITRDEWSVKGLRRDLEILLQKIILLRNGNNKIFVGSGDGDELTDGMDEGNVGDKKNIGINLSYDDTSDSGVYLYGEQYTDGQRTGIEGNNISLRKRSIKIESPDVIDMICHKSNLRINNNSILIKNEKNNINSILNKMDLALTQIATYINGIVLGTVTYQPQTLNINDLFANN